MKSTGTGARKKHMVLLPLISSFIRMFGAPIKEIRFWHCRVGKTDSPLLSLSCNEPEDALTWPKKISISSSVYVMGPGFRINLPYHWKKKKKEKKSNPERNIVHSAFLVVRTILNFSFSFHGSKNFFNWFLTDWENYRLFAFRVKGS